MWKVGSRATAPTARTPAVSRAAAPARCWVPRPRPARRSPAGREPAPPPPARRSERSAGVMKRIVIGTLALGLLTGLTVQGQQKAPAAKPAPRWPDGRISFSGTPSDIGNWEGPAD